MASIIDLYNADKTLQVKTGGDLTPYYSEGNNGSDANLVDEKSISTLESKIGSRYGKGMGPWGATYNDQKGKKYSEQAKKD